MSCCVINLVPRPRRSELVPGDSSLLRTDRLGIFLQDQIAFADNLKLLVGGRFDTVDQENDDFLAGTTSTQYDEAFATTDPDNPDFVIPIGEQRSRGIELDVTGEILPGWNIITAFSYINAEVTESNDIPVGIRIENVPEYTVSLQTTYEIPRGDLQGLGFGVGLFYVGEKPGDFENSYVLPSYLRTDAAIYYRRDNWRAAINIKNLFDVEYFESVNFGREAIEVGAPLNGSGDVFGGVLTLDKGD